MVNKDTNLNILLKEFENRIPDIDKLLIFCTENKCSDLYLKVGKQPYISRYGNIYKVPCFELTSKIWQEWAKYAISSENNAKYVRQKMLDFSYVVKDENQDNLEFRYRVSAGFSLGKNIATFRMISKELPSFETINFPKDLENILKQIITKKEKIVMFVGPTGSGKTTTMASCINDFSKQGGPLNNVVTISLEDPIEYIFESNENFNILQKELGVDFKDFALGVKQSLREHPNFINVGETRDLETIQALIEAARTGHGIITSFHARDVADTISRLYNHLANENQEAMYDLISNIALIICQRLEPNDSSFILKTQYMIFTDHIVRYLNKAIELDKNIPTVINELFKNEDLLKYGLIKDWN